MKVLKTSFNTKLKKRNDISTTWNRNRTQIYVYVLKVTAYI